MFTLHAAAVTLPCTAQALPARPSLATPPPVPPTLPLQHGRPQGPVVRWIQHGEADVSDGEYRISANSVGDWVTKRLGTVNGTNEVDRLQKFLDHRRSVLCIGGVA